MLRICRLTFVLMFLITGLRCQTDSLQKTVFKNRKIILASSSSALTIGSLIFLNQVWYSDYNTGRFHFFDDNREWLQMDKLGHICATYQTSRLMMEAFNWAGYSKKQKLIIGGGMGFAYMTAIEVMDGFSSGWGYSWGDQLANALGSGMAIAQEAYWGRQAIQLKFSYSQSGLAKYNPSLLGESKYSQILKDYNGQTYWLSMNLATFMKKESKFPKWLNVALGYSAYGMLGGFYNRVTAIDNNGNILKIERQRRFYVSLDVDLKSIRTKSKILRGIFSVFNILKFPLPALEYSNNGLHFYPVYY
jgi:Predicted periplasmic lipoprotein (DUF2279)